MQTSVDRRVQGTWSCFSAFDRGEIPSPVEDDSEAAWREFDACWEALEQRVMDLGWTARGADPWTHEPRGKAAARRTAHEAADGLQVDAVMRLARANDRVCPVAPAWRKLHQLLCVMLQPRRTDPAPAPVEASAWDQTTDLQKRLRLREQLSWARHHGGLHVAHEYLRSLSEDDWQHHTPAAWPSL